MLAVPFKSRARLVMGNFNMVPGQRARRTHLSLPSSAVLARQPLEYLLPDEVPG